MSQDDRGEIGRKQKTDRMKEGKKSGKALRQCVERTGWWQGDMSEQGKKAGRCGNSEAGDKKGGREEGRTYTGGS